ncbi:unnamed protein product [Peniophora sp. CBMAI 1063]|nr:unnamed protein product [Peniophora sp. CBMAI 1063]
MLTDATIGDGKQASSEKCTNCRDHRWNCTFYNAPGKKVSPGYIEALELKVQRLQGLINRLLPGRDFTYEVGFELTRDNWMLPGVCGASELGQPSAFVVEPTSSAFSARHTPDTAPSSALSVMPSGHATPETPMSDNEFSSDEDRRHPPIKLQHLRGVSQWVSWSHYITHYLGKSLSTGLIKTALEMCRELMPGIPTNDVLRFRSKVWDRPDWLNGLGDTTLQRSFHFPDRDVLDQLVELYFANYHIIVPILHRPTFEEDLRSNLHLHDRTFGTVVLLVCALGSRWARDPRVLETGDTTWLSAGWKWFIQCRVLDDAALASPSSHLRILQALCLAAVYVPNVSLTHGWMYIGQGIRLAVDIGAHKRRVYGANPTLEDEMFKRAVWILIHMDRAMSTIMGRPCCIQEEDFDLEMMRCCDDEYLTPEDPELFGIQPPDKPSILTYFVWSMKLSQIQGLALRTLYASTKAKAHFNFQGEEWLTRTVARFDSLLNGWEDSIPEHLRWHPEQPSEVFLAQSAQLYAQYYTTQILVHRAQMLVPPRAPVSYPSLAICTSAARSLIRVAGVIHRRKRELIGSLTWQIQTAAMVTIVTLGHARLGNINIDRKKALADVDWAISVLREGEIRWRWSGRQADVVESLRVLGEAPAEEFLPMDRRKRSHEADDAADPGTIMDQLGAIPGADVSQPPLYGGDPSATDWNAPLMTFGPAVSDELAPYSMDYAQGNTVQPHSADAVFGNIDFDALFGFGNVNTEGLRPWSPAPFEGALDMPPADTVQEGTSLGVEDWSSLTVDYSKTEDWQWTALQQDAQSEGPSTSYGHSRMWDVHGG